MVDQGYSLVATITLAVGISLWIVGGFIGFRSRYDASNQWLRGRVDSSGKPTRIPSGELLDAYFGNAKSRWWCLIGWYIALAGFGLFAFDEARLYEEDSILRLIVPTLIIIVVAIIPLRSFVSGLRGSRPATGADET